MVLKWLKRLLLWIRGVVLMAVGMYICQDIFQLFFNDTASIVLSATVVGLLAAMRQRDVDIDEK